MNHIKLFHFLSSPNENLIFFFDKQEYENVEAQKIVLAKSFPLYR